MNRPKTLARAADLLAGSLVACSDSPTDPSVNLPVWLYKENPSGMFSDWNPTVSCAAAR